MDRSSGAQPPRMVLVLVYDTAAEPLAPGIRAVVQRARRLMYSADDAELVLEVSPERTPRLLRLFGQLLDDGEPVEGAIVHLAGSDAPARATDEEGEFRIGELPAGAYRLSIDLPDRGRATVPLPLD